MNESELPPLPEPSNPIRQDDFGPYRDMADFDEDLYTAAQMREYALAALRQRLKGQV